MLILYIGWRIFCLCRGALVVTADVNCMHGMNRWGDRGDILQILDRVRPFYLVEEWFEPNSLFGGLCQSHVFSLTGWKCYGWLTFGTLTDSSTPNVENKFGSRSLCISIAWTVSIGISCQRLSVTPIYSIQIEDTAEILKNLFDHLLMIKIWMRKIATDNKYGIYNV